MSQILFDCDSSQKSIQINLGISQIFPKEDYKSSLGPSKLSVYYTNQINSPARIKKLKMFSDHADKSDHDDEAQKEVFAQDVFDLGYILLISSTGGLDLINQEALDFSDHGDT
jgi:hypothetical protein